MHALKKSIVLIITSLLVAGVQAGIIHVPGDQPTIQDGIDATSEHDTVLVDTGRYVENINFNGNNIVVGSLFLTTGDTSFISRTIIDGDSSGSVVVFENEEDSTTVLSGFTITNGSGKLDFMDDICGGGIFCYGADPNLSHLIIRGNSAERGGGIAFYHSRAILENSIICHNGTEYTDYGGGFDCRRCENLMITNCAIYSNFSRYKGGAIHTFGTSRLVLWKTLIYGNTCMYATFAAQGTSPIILVNTTICNNYAEHLGGVLVDIGDLIAVNSIFWNNSGDISDTQISVGQYMGMGTANLYIFNSDVMNGLDGICTDDSTGYSHLGIIDSDPLFVDAENFDYHLTANSPCIDAGIPLLAWFGDTIAYIPPEEYIGRAPDLGAYEYVAAEVSPILHSANPGDFIITSIYPNPFNSSTNVSIVLPVSSGLRLSVFNIAGQEVALLADERYSVGYHQFTFNADDLSSGIYFIHATVPGKMNEIRKVVLLR